MYTSIVLVALAGASFSAIPESVQFKTDYVAARKVGRTDRKPLAVFIGNGSKGWEARTTEGQLSQESQKLLQEHYVCVYIDTATEEGKRLARDFEMESGLVLSDAAGENQAFRHSGKLPNGDLERQLKKFSDPERVPSRTETLTRDDVRYYPPEASGSGQSGYYAPAQSGYYAPPAYAPSPFGGGCSSCGGGSSRGRR
jgi:hypothetical protein